MKWRYINCFIIIIIVITSLQNACYAAQTKELSLLYVPATCPLLRMDVELTFSASIKLSSQAYMTFPGFHANLYKSCNNGWIDYVANGFIPVQIVPDECLMSKVKNKFTIFLTLSRHRTLSKLVSLSITFIATAKGKN